MTNPLDANYLKSYTISTAFLWLKKLFNQSIFKYKKIFKKHQTSQNWIKRSKDKCKWKLVKLLFVTEPSFCKILSLHKNNKNAKNKNMILFQKRFMLETCSSKCKIRSLETDLEFYKKNIKNFVTLSAVISWLFWSNINHISWFWCLEWMKCRCISRKQALQVDWIANAFYVQK